MTKVRKLLVFALSLCIPFYGLLFPLSQNGRILIASAESVTFDGGSGTISDPYLISSPEQLNAVRNNDSACYKLENDIDLSAATVQGGEFYNNGMGWTPIGEGSPFYGTFDGNGHKIEGLNSDYSNDSSVDYIGLFSINEGTIENLGIVNSNITGNEYAGAIAGQNDSVITNCYNAGNVTINNSNYTYCQAGGIAGLNYSSGIISNCYNTGNISTNGSGSTYLCLAGGITGQSDGLIQISYNSGDIYINGSSSYSEAGGIAGNNNSSISNCYNNGDVSSVSATFNYSGGISAVVEGTVNDCYNSGSISSGTYAGGSCFKLMNDIDLTNATSQGGEFYNGGAGWQPIGDDSSCFYGAFDGNGYTITAMLSPAERP